MPADLSDPLFFSALLEGCKSAVNEMVKGRSNRATQRLALMQLLDRLGYRAPIGKRGSMVDLRSDRRLNLILDFNTAIVQEYGQWHWLRSESGIIDAIPAQELIRVGRRKFMRDWNRIWDEAREVLPETSAFESSSGRLVALIDDPIWTQISDFGLPWPPFKFGSGMGVHDIGFEEACELGLVQDEPRELHIPLKEAIIELLTNDMVGPARPPPQITPDFERLMILTLGDIDPALLPPSWN